MIQLRQLPSFQWGKLSVLVADEQIFAFTRTSYDFPAYLVVMNISDRAATANLLINSDIAPRAYVVCYIAAKETHLAATYTSDAPVLTKQVALNARDCLVLTWFSPN